MPLTEGDPLGSSSDARTAPATSCPANCSISARYFLAHGQGRPVRRFRLLGAPLVTQIRRQCVVAVGRAGVIAPQDLLVDSQGLAV
jgi:hypothetical protein